MASTEAESAADIIDINRGKVDKRTCDHGLRFDANAVAGMTVAEVRRMFPRLDGKCKRCGFEGIAYVSMEHYTYGDW